MLEVFFLKLDELCAVAEATNPQVMCIVESWLSDEISDNELVIDNYQILRLNRNRYCHVYPFFTIVPLHVLSAGANELELLVVSVSSLNSSSKFCISLFYRPPSSSVEVFDSLCTA